MLEQFKAEQVSKFTRGKCLVRRLSLSLVACLAAFGTVFNTAYAEVTRSDNSADISKCGVPLYEWQESSVKDPKSIVVVIHGAAQQGAAVEALARSLASIGYLVVAPDLRGSGRWNTMTIQKPTSAFSDFDRSCDDLFNILKMLRNEHPKSRIFCIGESAGSTVVLSAVARDASKVKGIILCSAGSEPKLHAPGSMGPDFYRQLMHVTTPVDMSKFMTRYSSDDSRVAYEMVHDPLGRNKLSALELLGTFNFIQQGTTFARQIPRSLPALLIQGKEDQIINPNSSVRLLSSINSTDKNILMLPGCGHILIGTSFIKPIVEESIESWLARHGGINVSVSKAMPQAAPNFQRDSASSLQASGNRPFSGYANPADYSEPIRPANAANYQYPPPTGERIAYPEQSTLPANSESATNAAGVYPQPVEPSAPLRQSISP
ncbi:MAG TPA: alpha/beta fold hydrolase [Oculatellaceae cyanobacterium]